MAVSLLSFGREGAKNICIHVSVIKLCESEKTNFPTLFIYFIFKLIYDSLNKKYFSQSICNFNCFLPLTVIVMARIKTLHY